VVSWAVSLPRFDLGIADFGPFRLPPEVFFLDVARLLCNNASLAFTAALRVEARLDDM
jgi:hypothetical protein